MYSSRKGFTIVELIVVITIIGILAAVTIPSFRPFIEKAKFSNNQVLIDDIVKTMSLIETKEEKDIRTLSKSEFINLYNKYHQRYLNTNRFYDLGLNEDGELLIIVIYKDLYTIYNYDTKEYINSTNESEVIGLLAKPTTEEPNLLSFERFEGAVLVNAFLDLNEEKHINCYLYQNGEYEIYFHDQLIDQYLDLKKDSDLTKVEEIISEEFEARLKPLELPGSKTFLVYLEKEDGPNYALYQEGEDTIIGRVSQLHLELIISS